MTDDLDDSPAARPARESGSARAYWTVAPGEGEIREEALPGLSEGAVIVRALHSALSRGTERLVHRGDVPHSERARMRAPFQIGEFPFPVKYGYSVVGEVEAGPDYMVGLPVFCLHPHQDRFVVPATDVIPIGEEVPLRRAALAANAETAVNILWDARPCVGDRIAVIGAGVVGCLVARFAAATAGARVALVDVRASRAEVADALEVEFALPENARDIARDVDLVIHASGSPEGLPLALSLAGDEATIVEASWYGDKNVSLPLGEAFHSRRLRIASSQVGKVPEHRARRWSSFSRLALALRLLDDPALDVLLTSEDPFDDIVTALPRALDDPDTLCATFRYGSD